MDSGSDSDGSHISSTPPRDSLPPPPPPPKLPPKPPALCSSTKSRTKIATTAHKSTTITSSRPILRPVLRPKLTKPSSTSKPKESHQKGPPESPIPPPNLTNLPFQIHQNLSFSSHNDTSTQTLLPNSLCLSKFASFSKIKNKNFNFETTDADITPAEDDVSMGPHELGGNVSLPSVNVVKVARKHPNSIGASNVNVDSKGNGNVCSNAKKPKCVNEGNFVRLNINGYGKKKYAFKSKRNGIKSMSNGGRKFYRSKKKLGNGGKDEENGSFDEDGLVVNVRGEKGKVDFDMELVEEAVVRVRSEASDENLVRLLKVMYGYDSFREGQLEAIKMVLSGESTVLVLPTGAGKSLCYQLPALVLPGVTLVVSPLVALMIDQLKHLPPAISGGLLSSSQTLEEYSEILRLLHEGELKVLFVSPERFLNAEFTSILSGTLISLVVVDEAHCVSEWSHNFRPSYMRLRASLLRDKLNAKCILAMTATATTKTLHELMNALEISPRGLIQSTQVRENLQLSVSISGNRMKDLLMLIKSSPFLEAKSIIIYCKFQYETDIVSKYLWDNNIRAKSYHSAIPAKDRSRIQDMFCSNKLRVVVATVAFGMGLDKSNIGAVIHYTLPESLEEYVQEIGRAGRDGTLSYCHLFYDDVSYLRLRSLMYSDGVDEYAVNKFLCQIFSNGLSSSGNICSLVKESASRRYDIKEEVMLTILTQLELGDSQYLHLLPQMNVTCTLNFHQSTPAMLASKDMVVAAILKKAEVKDGQYVFDIPSVANSLKVQAGILSDHLQTLKSKGEITYELKDQAYCYMIVSVPKDICSLAAQLTKWLSEVESCKVQKIDAMYNAAVAAVKECDKLHGCCGYQHTYCLQRKIFEYFNRDDNCDVPNKMNQISPFLRADIKVFLQSNAHARFTPRAIARIMHGLGSPAFPSTTWSKTHFWGRYTQTDFQVIMEAAKAELMSFVGKDII